MTTPFLSGIKDGFEKESEKEVSWNPLDWSVGMKVPGGSALQNPAMAGIGGGLLGALVQQALSKKSPNMNTLISALIPGGILGGMSWSARKALNEGQNNES